MVSEISFLSVSHYKSTETPERRACPRGLIGRFYEGAGVNINTYKDIGCGPHGSRKQDFLKLFPFNLQGGASLSPGGLIGRIYVGDY